MVTQGDCSHIFKVLHNDLKMCYTIRRKSFTHLARDTSCRPTAEQVAENFRHAYAECKRYADYTKALKDKFEQHLNDKLEASLPSAAFIDKAAKRKREVDVTKSRVHFELNTKRNELLFIAKYGERLNRLHEAMTKSLIDEGLCITRLEEAHVKALQLKLNEYRKEYEDLKRAIGVNCDDKK